MAKFKNKYRIESIRAPFWDYGWNAAYFVTICTKDRAHYFGDIFNGEIHLSEIGRFAETCWHEIPQHFPFVDLGNHIIMPNHVHGIIIINKPNTGRSVGGMVDTQDITMETIVETQDIVSPQYPPTTPSSTPKNQFGPQSKNLASIIRGFKIGVTKNARKINPDFAWQSRFHDHIIRNKISFQNISKYIINNPKNWTGDTFHVEK